jgi:FkbM family methyltransferase
MLRFGRLMLKNLSPIVRLPAGIRTIEAFEMFSSALLGRGGGSGWDAKGQNAALSRHINGKQSPLVIFDVGANNGAWIEGLASHMGQPEASYHLFECAPYCFEPLAKRASRLNSAKIIKKAVSNVNGTVTLHLPRFGSGLASLHERHDTSIDNADFDRLEVESIRLDDYAEENEIQYVDVLKIDIEGHELFALEGAEKLLSRKGIGTIFFEFGSSNLNSRTYFKDFWNLLKPLGYDLFRVIPGGNTIEVQKYDDRLEYFRGASNYIAQLRNI